MGLLQGDVNRHLLSELDGNDLFGTALNFQLGEASKEADTVL